MSKIARPCANGSGELNVLWVIVAVLPVVIWGFESTPPMLRIWDPPTALQVWPWRGSEGLYGTLIQWKAGRVRMEMVSYWMDAEPRFVPQPAYTKLLVP